MQTRPLNDDRLGAYNTDGFVRYPAMIDLAVIDSITGALSSADIFHKIGPLEYAGFTQPSNDTLGHVVRLDWLVAMAEQLLGAPCYHYHTKLVRKRAGQSMALTWHQDYGSWYKDGCLSPDLVTCVIALTEATERNGCFQLLRGSHRLGRLDRLREGHESYSYFSLSPARLAAIEERYEREIMAMNPGDAFFFHANTLHASGPNLTNNDRVLLEITYNKFNNPPVFEGQDYHRFVPLDRVSHSRYAALQERRPIDFDNLIAADADDDPRAGVFRRRFDTAQC